MKLQRYLILALLLLPVLSKAQPMSNQEFLQKFQLARIYEAQGALQNSARLYEELFRAQPENPDVYEGYVNVLFALKRYGSADSILSDLLSHSNSDRAFDLYLLLGKTRSLLGKKPQAIEAFNDAIAHAEGRDPYSATIAVSGAMTEVGYDEDALKLLYDHRGRDQESQYFTPEIARLLFKLGRYADGTKEYLSMLRDNNQSPAFVESRISMFTADSTTRRSIMKTVIAQIDADNATVAQLQLLGWCYGELRDYDNALDVALRIDKQNSRAGNGYNLYQFAEKALAEGAFDAAARAYSEAATRAAATGGTQAKSALYYQAQLGVLRAKLAALRRQTPRDPEAIRKVVAEYAAVGSSDAPNEIAITALTLAGDAALGTLHDPAMAKPYYEDIVRRSRSLTDGARNAYFALETIALAQADLGGAREELDRLLAALEQRPRPDDAETRRHILFEQARIFYFEGRFDTALATLAPIVATPTSDFANDAIALHSLITENREGASDGAMRVFAKAELLSLGSDLNSALVGYQSIRQTYPKAPIADEATLRAADLMVTLGKPNEAVTLLEDMQEKMTDSPLLDRAAVREAEITEHELKAKDKALKLYEDFLARYPKSPLCTEVRQRARKLRGDVF